ncbi:MAG: hypothetical protein L0271_15885 [Gemmatimonadetes bacterium]|nr:hypothetical protein [Gemmatimonadota bacterium]
MEFFARIHAKAVGAGPLLRPRLASWYADPVEPAPAEVPSDDATPAPILRRSASPSMSESGAAAPRDADAPIRRPLLEPIESERSQTHSRVPDAPIETPAPAERLARDRRQRSPAPESREARDGSEESAPARSERRSRRDAPRVPPIAEPEPAPSVDEVFRTARPERARSRRSREPVAEPAAEIERLAPAARERLRAPISPREPVLLENVETVPARGQTIAVPLLAPAGPSPATLLPLPSRARRERQPRAEPLLSTAVSPPTPVIEVTIGRVDVRAIASPQAPTPPSPRGMSLDEYLQRRPGAGA